MDTQSYHAYIFGANTAIGDTLLNQLLANQTYQAIYISTHTPLPSTTVHLNSILVNDTFTWSTAVEHIDCFFIIQPHSNTSYISPSGIVASRHRHKFYQPLSETDAPALFKQLFKAKQSIAHHTHLTIRWLVIAPYATVPTLNQWLCKYETHIPILTYSDDSKIDSMKEHYRFKSQGNTVLDRIGLLLLNTMSAFAHTMLYGRQKYILTPLKLVQQLIEQFNLLKTPPLSNQTKQSNQINQTKHPIKHLSKQDLIPLLK